MATRQRNNLAAGLFLFAGLALAVGISFWLGGLGERIGAKKTYRVMFDLDRGAPGIEPGSPVRLAGQPVGRVVSVEIVRTDDGVPAYIEAQISVDAAYSLHEDARANLESPILGGLSVINIARAGAGPWAMWGNDGDGELEDGEAIAGVPAPGILAQMGFGPADADRVRAVLAQAEKASADAASFTARLDGMAATLQARFPSSVESAGGFLDNARVFSDRFNGPEGWSGRVDRILTRAEASFDAVPDVVGEINAAVADTRSLLAATRQAVDESRVRVTRVLAHAEGIAERVRYDSIDRVHGLLDEGVIAAGTYGQLGERLNLIVDRESPQLRTTLTNVRLVSEQAKLFLQEFRAQPWRLLSQPSRAELEREPLYNAARQYATAVADLRAASESLESIVTASGTGAGLGAGSAVDAATIEGMRSQVRDAFGRYQQAEQELLDLLGGR